MLVIAIALWIAMEAGSVYLLILDRRISRGN